MAAVNGKRTRGPLGFVLLGLIGLWLGSAPPAAAGPIRALVFNATGENLRVVVNGRGHLMGLEEQAVIFDDPGGQGLAFETANLDGQLLSVKLAANQAYVILVRQSLGVFVLWRLEELGGAMSQMLTEHSGKLKAIVFNASGRRLFGRQAEEAFKLDRANCLLFPTGQKPEELKFKLLEPDLPEMGPLESGKRYILADRPGQGLGLVAFEAWAADLAQRVNGSYQAGQETASPIPPERKVEERDIR